VLCASGQAKGIAVTTGTNALAGLAAEDTVAVPIEVAVIGAVLVTCSALLAEAVSVLLDVGTAVDSDRGIASIVVVDVKVLVSVSLDTIILL
jgi:hypothetical protein